MRIAKSGQDARLTRGRDARDTLDDSLKAAGFGDGLRVELLINLLVELSLFV